MFAKHTETGLTSGFLMWSLTLTPPPTPTAFSLSLVEGLVRTNVPYVQLATIAACIAAAFRCGCAVTAAPACVMVLLCREHSVVRRDRLNDCGLRCGVECVWTERQRAARTRCVSGGEAAGDCRVVPISSGCTAAQRGLQRRQHIHLWRDKMRAAVPTRASVGAGAGAQRTGLSRSRRARVVQRCWKIAGNKRAATRESPFARVRRR